MLICCKSILLGDSRVGKSTFLRNVAEEGGPAPSETIGIDFRFVPNIPNARVMMWDVSGRELFRPIVKPHYHHTHVVFFVYDVSKRASFLNIPLWYQEYQTVATPMTMVLIANQRNPPMVDSIEGLALAKQMGMQFVEMDVLTGDTHWVRTLFLNVLPLLKSPAPKNVLLNKTTQRRCFASWVITI